MAPAVHPRACGEHYDYRVCVPLIDGSSPRLRGTWLSDTARTVSIRFIPAPAGNIGRTSGNRTGAAGSSPRLRGTCRCALAARCRSRFIPAPAGNIPTERRNPPYPAVHPRACGEHNVVDFDFSNVNGSSPRLRGTSLSRYLQGNKYRFIPAPAGNMSGTGGWPKGGTVHPRACGEHALPSDEASPTSRFIPAPAGNMQT